MLHFPLIVLNFVLEKGEEYGYMNIFNKAAPSVVFIDTYEDIPLENEIKWKDKEKMKRLELQWRKKQDRLKKGGQRYVLTFLWNVSQNI